ncbi:MAG: acetate--CoA ligase family protein [Deltaproteobacteria bacterium]|uniref:acetate--CoA ligase family protein n=1 Tax=Desulfobacula sp. TaxID=2593537 RepID=UPI00199EE7AC|nr:acetate--CoA ligase family protein [Candidatus Desulfobacula maris]MBL6993511.1 acetate--CoA ligase family protein [Desulfobacula sp.]
MMEKKLKLWFKSLEDKEHPDEFDAKQLVKLYSIKVPQGRRLKPKDEFDLNGIDPPYVLKVCSSNILHKTEFQGVVLNNDNESVQDNFNKIQQRFPNENILVENQSTYMGPEFIIGIIKDPALGHAVMVGAGGVLTEIYKDTAFRLAPCSVNEAMDMIDELVLSPVFENFRGMTLDKEKLAQTISQVARLAHDLGDKLSQLDINPIVFSDGEWIALDVKVMFE